LVIFTAIFGCNILQYIAGLTCCSRDVWPSNGRAARRVFSLQEIVGQACQERMNKFSVPFLSNTQMSLTLGSAGYVGAPVWFYEYRGTRKITSYYQEKISLEAKRLNKWLEFIVMTDQSFCCVENEYFSPRRCCCTSSCP
jgi:hypothetical protein